MDKTYTQWIVKFVTDLIKRFDKLVQRSAIWKNILDGKESPEIEADRRWINKKKAEWKKLFKNKEQ